jgi:hypothetical protein
MLRRKGIQNKDIRLYTRGSSFLEGSTLETPGLDYGSFSASKRQVGTDCNRRSRPID